MANRICNILGIKYPIIQGPTNWTTDADYVAAVSMAGGLGVLGFSAGQEAPVFTVEETIANMRAQVHRVRELTDKPFGINIGPTSADPEEDMFTLPMIDMMAEEGVPVAVMGAFELIPEWVARLHERNIKVVFKPQTPTVECAKQAVDAGVDALAAIGFDEGGTLPVNPIGTFSIVPMMADALEGRIPLLAAGGIVDKRTARAAFDLGAEGLIVGTAFLLTKEAPIADNIKEMAIKADATDLLFYRTVPAFYRSLPGELPNKLVEMSKAGASEEDIYEAQRQYNGMRDGMRFGDLSIGYASFGLGISQITSIDTVDEVMQRIAAGIPEDQR